MEEAARALVEAHLDPALRDFNLDQVRGSELSLESLASLLGTPPMMANRRVVVLREVEGLAGNARARDLLTATAAAPPPGLVLVLLSTSTSTAAFWKTLEKSARSAKFPALGEEDLPGWLMERARERHGREMDEEAATALASALGGELGILARELEKLHAVAPDGEPITRAVVESAGLSLPSQDRWKWFDLVGEARFAEAVAALPVLEAQGETPVGLVIGITNQLLRIGVLLEEGTRGLEAALPPNQRWLARRVAGQSRNWTGAAVEEALAGLLEVDRELKSGGGMGILERWLLTWAFKAKAA